MGQGAVVVWTGKSGAVGMEKKKLGTMVGRPSDKAAVISDRQARRWLLQLIPVAYHVGWLRQDAIGIGKEVLWGDARAVYGLQCFQREMYLILAKDPVTLPSCDRARTSHRRRG